MIHFRASVCGDRVRCRGYFASAHDTHRGVLDLSVDLSVPEIYAGTDFTLYLHIKNPFAQRVWIRPVELSLPTQLSWKPTVLREDQERIAPKIDHLEGQIKTRQEQIVNLEKRRQHLADEQEQQRDELSATIDKLNAANRDDQALRAHLLGATVVSVADPSEINVRGMRAENIYFTTGDRASINIVDLQSVTESERVPLAGSLPKGIALEPGCTDVWTIRLGSSRGPSLYRPHSAFSSPSSTACMHLKVVQVMGAEMMKC